MPHVAWRCFYDVPDRRSSGESDFGCWWWDGPQGYSDQWRLSVVEVTGEIYAIRERPLMRDAGEGARVVLLGSLGPDLRYEKAHACLAGWEEICGQAESLQWVVDRVKLATGMAVAEPAVLEDAAALDELAVILHRSPRSSGAEFRVRAAEIVRRTGRNID
jgi:hypothetical protein